MARSGSLHDVFVDELRDVYHAERQVLKALPKMVKRARADELRQALASHLEETKAQVNRLEQVFAAVGDKVRATRCEGMAGIIVEGKSAMKKAVDGHTMDACLVAAARRVEHYEMAAYGTLILWARALGHHDAAALLATTLGEEVAADSKLSSLAASGLPPAADDPEEASEKPRKASTRARKNRQGKKQARE